MICWLFCLYIRNWFAAWRWNNVISVTLIFDGVVNHIVNDAIRQLFDVFNMVGNVLVRINAQGNYTTLLCMGRL
jgi:hypothetical protein